MKVLSAFQRDILTLRSHQWKYFLEPFVGCGLHCLYCIYGGSNEFFAKVKPREGLLSNLRDDLACLEKKQIIYIGATVDPYQPIEKEHRLTQSVLRLLLDYEMPVMILTKSPDILDDLELLLEFNKRGHILVQFTLLTVNESKSRVLEKQVVSPGLRLRAAERLREEGIPVHFHVSPYIPGFYSGNELSETVKAISDYGGTCIYTNTLGMRYSNQEILYKAFQYLDKEMASEIEAVYPKIQENRPGVYSPFTEHVIDDMLHFRDVCLTHKINYVCEFIPQFTVFSAEEFEKGIFRFGLPAVYQMMRFWEGKDTTMISWEAFRTDFLAHYAYIDPEYLELVKKFWDSGELFENTIITPKRINDEVLYYKGDKLIIDNDKILSWV